MQFPIHTPSYQARRNPSSSERTLYTVLVVWSAVVIVRHLLYWGPRVLVSISAINNRRFFAAVIEGVGLVLCLLPDRQLRRWGCVIAVVGVLFAAGIRLLVEANLPPVIIFERGVNRILGSAWEVWSVLQFAAVPAVVLLLLLRSDSRDAAPI